MSQGVAIQKVQMMVCNVVLQEQNVDVLMRIRSVNLSTLCVGGEHIIVPFSPNSSPSFFSFPFSSHPFPILFPTFPLSPPLFFSLLLSFLSPSLPLSLSSSLLLDVVWKGMKWFCTGQKMAHSTPSRSGS